MKQESTKNEYTSLQTQNSTKKVNTFSWLLLWFLGIKGLLSEWPMKLSMLSCARRNGLWELWLFRSGGLAEDGDEGLEVPEMLVAPPANARDARRWLTCLRCSPRRETAGLFWSWEPDFVCGLCECCIWLVRVGLTTEALLDFNKGRAPALVCCPGETEGRTAADFASIKWMNIPQMIENSFIYSIGGIWGWNKQKLYNKIKQKKKT